MSSIDTKACLKGFLWYLYEIEDQNVRGWPGWLEDWSENYAFWCQPEIGQNENGPLSMEIYIWKEKVQSTFKVLHKVFFACHADHCWQLLFLSEDVRSTGSIWEWPPLDSDCGLSVWWPREREQPRDLSGNQRAGQRTTRPSHRGPTCNA